MYALPLATGQRRDGTRPVVFEIQVKKRKHVKLGVENELSWSHLRTGAIVEHMAGQETMDAMQITLLPIGPVRPKDGKRTMKKTLIFYQVNIYLQNRKNLVC